MPTVSSILSRVSLQTSFQNSGTEQTLMTAFINEIYQEAQEQSECWQPTTTIAFTANDPDATFTNTNIVRVISATILDLDGYDKLTLTPISRAKLNELQDVTTTVGIPRYYHIDTNTAANTSTMTLYPTPESACTVTLHTVSVTGSDLTSSDTPTALPTRYHHRILSNGACAMCFDREGKHDRADVFWGRYFKALAELTDWVNQNQGERVDSHFVGDINSLGRDRSRDV